MKDIGYGKDYAYDHSVEGGFSGQDYWPEGMNAESFYEPTDRGFEARVRERLAYWQEMRREKQTRSDDT
jgi:putative ATPase